MVVAIVPVAVKGEEDSAVVVKPSVHQNRVAVVGSPRDRFFVVGFSVADGPHLEEGVSMRAPLRWRVVSPHPRIQEKPSVILPR